MLRTVYIAFDADGTGDEKARELARRMKQRGATVRRLRPGGGAKDWDEWLKKDRAGLVAFLHDNIGSPYRGEVDHLPEKGIATGENMGTESAHVFATAPNPKPSIPAPTAANPAPNPSRDTYHPPGTATDGDFVSLRETDPARHAEYMQAVRLALAIGQPAPTLLQWEASSLPVEDGDAESLDLAQEMVRERADEQAFADSWAAWVDYLESLPAPMPWPKTRGCTVPDIALWLRLAGERRNNLYQLHGAAWRESRAGQALVADLSSLSEFLLPLSGKESFSLCN
jgi:hypothetical protein